MKKLLIIEDRAKRIHFKNRKLRTPVNLRVTDEELKQLKVEMKMAGVEKWKIDNIRENIVTEEVKCNYDVCEPKIEKLETEASTILEKLMKNGEAE